jgi:hypothetical protein
MRITAAVLTAVALMLSLVGCQSQPPQVTHVVICWLKNPGREADRQRLIDEADKLKEIPGVVSLVSGRPIVSPRQIVDSTWDVAFVFTFKDEDALNAYLRNPMHLRAVNDILRPLAAKMIIYDIRRGEAGAPVMNYAQPGDTTQPATTQPTAVVQPTAKPQ